MYEKRSGASPRRSRGRVAAGATVSRPAFNKRSRGAWGATLPPRRARCGGPVCSLWDCVITTTVGPCRDVNTKYRQSNLYTGTFIVELCCMFFSSGQAFLGPPTPPLLLLWQYTGCGSYPSVSAGRWTSTSLLLGASSHVGCMVRRPPREAKESAARQGRACCFPALCHTACTLQVFTCATVRRWLTGQVISSLQCRGRTHCHTHSCS